MEYEETLLSGLGKGLKSLTFRIMDPTSRRMLALRADMTAQISRIATDRLADATPPLRLCYTGQVLRVMGEGLSARRQFTQTGLELIGEESVSADVEVIRVAAGAMAKLGVKKLAVDFTLPTLFGLITGSAHATPQSVELSRAVDRKDVATVQKLGGKQAATLITLMEAAGPAEGALAALKKIPQAAKLVKQLQSIVQQVKTLLPGVSLSIDPLETRGFAYHTGVSFAIFDKGKGLELARGGRYQVGGVKSDFGNATGASFLIENVLSAAKLRKAKPRILVPSETDSETLLSLQKEGYVTVLSARNKPEMPEAKRLSCQALLIQGKIRRTE